MTPRMLDTGRSVNFWPGRALAAGAGAAGAAGTAGAAGAGAAGAAATKASMSLAVMDPALPK